MLAAEAALVLEAVPDATVNAVAKQLCEKALTGLGDGGSAARVPGCSPNAATWPSTTASRSASRPEHGGARPGPHVRGRPCADRALRAGRRRARDRPAGPNG